MDTLPDAIFHGLFSSVDPLGMILRTLMALLADALATVITSVYDGLFAITTVDLSTDAVHGIWAITTGISASLATILLVIAAFRAMIAQSNRYLLEALPGVVLALLGPQFAAAFLPWVAAASTDLAQVIVATTTPDLAASMRLLAGVGPNPMYEGLGLMAPLIAAMVLFGVMAVFFVLLFCMAGAVVLFVLSPFAFAGLVMGTTRSWFTKWATAMFALLFAKVPIAILLALAVSLFASSAKAAPVQSFVNAGAGLILGVGALLSPLLAYGLFSFMGAAATRPPVPSANPSRALGSAYYGSQMGRGGINGVKSAATKIRSSAAPGPSATTGTGSPDSPGTGAPTSGQPSTGTARASAVPAPMRRTATAASSGSAGHADATAASRGSTAAGTTVTGSTGGAATSGGAASGGAAGTAGTAVASGALTAGVGTAVVVGAAVAKKTTRTIKDGVTGTAATVADPSPAAPSISPRTAT